MNQSSAFEERYCTDGGSAQPARRCVVAKVLIVGGAGYVGGWLTDEAVRAGHDVVVFDRLLYEDTYLKDVTFVHGDVLDRASLQPHLRWADCVVWLAAIVGDPACALDAELTTATNVETVRHLVHDFGGRIVFPSTCSVYGAQDGELTEASPLAPLSLYAETKIDAERVLIDSGADAIIFRLGTLFGLGDAFSRLRADLVLNVLTVRAVLAGRMSVFGGRQFRPLLHVRDVATAMVPNIDTSHHGIYNLHCENITILDLAERIHQHVPEAVVTITETSFQDGRNYSVSSDLARGTFGFEPRWSVHDGIEEVAAVVREGRIRDISLARYSNVDTLKPLLSSETTPLGTIHAVRRRVGAV
jgi:nucleoside-diphosphate-sugar epimerase